MPLDTIWVVVIIIVALAAIGGTITALKKSNKPFLFPEGYEEREAEREAERKKNKEDNDDDSSGVV